MSFQCAICHATYLLDTEDLVDNLPCDCLVCKSCIRIQLSSQVQRHMSLVKQAPSHPQPASTVSLLVKGCCVLYHDRAAGVFVDAEITHVDLSVDPPQYGIHISSREPGTTKYTEATRLVAKQEPQQPRTQGEPGCSILASPELWGSAAQGPAYASAHTLVSWLTVILTCAGIKCWVVHLPEDVVLVSNKHLPPCSVSCIL